MRKRLAILGSTGSIGRQSLDVVRHLKDDFEVVAIAANNNSAEFEKQIKEFSPRAVSLSSGDDIPSALKKGRKFYGDESGLVEIARRPDVDIVVMAIVGTPGLLAAIEAIKCGKTIAIASKEILVAAGDIVMPLAKQHGALLLPLDSEHSAVFQCLQALTPYPPLPKGEGCPKGGVREVKRIILTASGGPFRKLSKEQLKKVKAKDALKHPTWNMGAKITIDSATLMNKGLEVIEAHHLFGVPYEKIEVVIHPQSIIHSMVEFVDGSVLAQMGPPDMRLAIQYALTYPDRKPSQIKTLDFAALSGLTFEKPDNAKFPCLKIAYDTGKKGGVLPAVMSAANDAAVNAYLNAQIGFLDIPSLVLSAVKSFSKTKMFGQKLSLNNILEAEKYSQDFIKRCII